MLDWWLWPYYHSIFLLPLTLAFFFSMNKHILPTSHLLHLPIFRIRTTVISIIGRSRKISNQSISVFLTQFPSFCLLQQTHRSIPFVKTLITKRLCSIINHVDRSSFLRPPRGSYLATSSLYSVRSSTDLPLVPSWILVRTIFEIQQHGTVPRNRCCSSRWSRRILFLRQRRHQAAGSKVQGFCAEAGGLSKGLQ